MPGLLAGAYPGADSAPCPVAPYYLNFLSKMVPGNSLEVWEMYWRNTDAPTWLASPHGQRIAAARLKETLAALHARIAPLPVFDLAAANASRAETVAAATTQAGLNAQAENRRIRAVYESIGQNAP